jgi:DNA modification methylase
MELNRCIIGDCRDSMRELIADGVRVQMCVTSPPYWGLRDYGHPGQIGLEPTVQAYIDTMVEVFGLIRELLADDGTVWLNIGDSYAQAGGPGWQGKNGQRADRRFTLVRDTVPMREIVRRPPDGLKPKDLVMMPARIALALQADGWWVRQDIIWSKPNPMPESVTDRCTKAHEYLFLLSKSERYYLDAKAISEPAAYTGSTGCVSGPKNGARAAVTGKPATGNETVGAGRVAVKDLRNRRSVWTIATQPYSEAHFAVMPPALVEPCILAGSRVGDVVLDPFFGSGTVGEVAQRLGRKWIGCDLQEAYAPLQARRTAQQGFEL